MTPTFRCPTHELLFVTNSPEAAPLLRGALGKLVNPVALTTLLHPQCLAPHLEAEDTTFPDVILLDLTPADSLGIVQYLKGSPTLHEIPVLVLLRTAFAETFRPLYDARVNCCMARPETEPEFEAALRSMANYWFQIAWLPSTSMRRMHATLDW